MYLTIGGKIFFMLKASYLYQKKLNFILHLQSNK